MKKLIMIACCAVALAVILGYCFWADGRGDTVENAGKTLTEVAERTPRPTKTPKPTATPKPTKTPKPTATPEPTPEPT
ncbi:MAG: hypothetical protein IKP17_10485, partial [Oscillospiraceae bacterium]|nr:hypothetical protein [Oscillospiraceae bacterium]